MFYLVLTKRFVRMVQISYFCFLHPIILHIAFELSRCNRKRWAEWNKDSPPF